MRASTLAIACAFAVIIAGAEAQDFSGVCLDPTDYDGSKQYTSTDEDDGSTHTSTCDALMTSLTTSSESPLAGEDFSPGWSCDGKSSEVAGTVHGYISAYGCCGTSGKSACWQDFSGVCLDPTDYDGSKQYTSTDEDDGSTHTSTCDALMTSLTTSSESPLAGEDFSPGWSCDGKSSEVAGTVHGYISAYGCCGTSGKSACWQDFSGVCLDPTDYDGSKQYTSTDEDDGSTHTSTCDALMSSLTTSSESPLAGEDFSPGWSCDGKSSEVAGTVHGYISAYGCCGTSGKSACWQDFSGVCLDPTDYDGSKQFTYEDDDGTTDTSTCDAMMTSTTSSESPLAGEDFSQSWSCDGKSERVAGTVRGYISASGCCGTSGKSACWQDFSGVCLDPTDYDGSKQFTYEDDDGTTGTSTCDAMMTSTTSSESPLAGEDFSQSWSCDGKSERVAGTVRGYISASGCCGTSGKSACWQELQDFSGVCLDPADYDPSKQYTYEDEDDGSTHTSTCDAVMSSLTTSSESPLAGEDFSQSWSCEGKSSAVTNLVQGITNIGCCGTISKSACWSEPTQANLCDSARIFFECDAIGSKSECIAVSSCQWDADGIGQCIDGPEYNRFGASLQNYVSRLVNVDVENCKSHVDKNLCNTDDKCAWIAHDQNRQECYVKGSSMLAAQKVEGSYASDIALVYMEVVTYEREVCVFLLETECSADVQCEWDLDHTHCTFRSTWAFTAYSNACVSKKDQAKKTRDTILAGITNARMKKKAELLANAAIAGVKVNKLTAKLEAADEATACSSAYFKSNVRPSLGACVATATTSGRRLAAAMYDVELLFSSSEINRDALTAAVNSLKAEGVQGVMSEASVDPITEMKTIPGIDSNAMATFETEAAAAAEEAKPGTSLPPPPPTPTPPKLVLDDDDHASTHQGVFLVLTMAALNFLL